jgi:importin-9
METIHSLFSRLLTPHLTDLLTSSLNHLRSLLSTYSRYYLSNAESVPPSSEGGSIDLPQLICPILDFFAAVSRGGRAKGWFGEENLRSLIALVFSYVQMAEEDVSIADVFTLDDG